MAKLNQVLAIRKGVQTTAGTAFTRVYQRVQKTALFNGLSKTYQALDENGQTFPAEGMKVQATVPDAVAEAAESLVRLFDVTYEIDVTNQLAAASVIVDGQTLVNMAPVSYLLFLEKQLADLATFVSKLPVLDPTRDWTDAEFGNGVWRSTPVVTQRTNKVPRNHVKAAATDKHPAQVETYFEDAVVGNWTTVVFSGAAHESKVRTLLARIRAVAEAVKQARELANSREVEVASAPGADVLGYIFG